MPSAEHLRRPGILDDMNGARDIVWRYLRGALPYPDLLRRSRMRRAARRLITCKQWPGNDATGMDAAQLALLRLLYLQQLTRSAVTERRAEEAALLARASIETAIVGLYCLHSGDAIADLSAALCRPSGRACSYLIDARLRSPEAVDGAVAALGELGPELNVRDLALWLEREQELVQAATLYHSYYVPLSHLFSRSYAFALMRHINADGSLRRRPAFQWTRCSAARVADGCTGLLAANIADMSGAEPRLFLRYATTHFGRALPPGSTFAVKGAIRAGRLRAFPAALGAMAGTQAGAAVPRHIEGEGQQEAAECAEYAEYGEFAGAYDDLAPDGRRTLLTMPIGDEDAGVLAWNDDPDADRQARHRRTSSG
jgi:hypothetical protein